MIVVLLASSNYYLTDQAVLGIPPVQVIQVLPFLPFLRPVLSGRGNLQPRYDQGPL